VTSLAEIELTRARWRRRIDGLALDTINRPDFGVAELAARLATPSVQFALLPADPEATDRVVFDDAFWAWFKAYQTVAVEDHSLLFGYQQHVTAHAAAWVEDSGRGQPWHRFISVDRAGAVVLGLGSYGAREVHTNSDQSFRVFALVSIVAYAQGMLAFCAAVQSRLSLAGPCLLAIGAVSTRDALLGNLAEGWAEPFSISNSVGGCIDEHLLWHIELDEIDEESTRDLAFLIGDRFEDAWGVTQRRYRARVGESINELDYGRVLR